MSGTDALAFAFAVVAVAVGLGLTAFLISSGGPPTDVEVESPRAPGLDVMLGGTGRSIRWRFESHADETITVDVFSQRAIDGTSTATSWRHELMEDAIRLRPGASAELPADPGGARYEAAIGWYVGDAPERRRDSRFVTVERPPD